jgi:predicted regulator of amino acid metabolism with ACT domain
MEMGDDVRQQRILNAHHKDIVKEIRGAIADGWFVVSMLTENPTNRDSWVLVIVEKDIT